VVVFDSHARLNISAVITITQKVFGFTIASHSQRQVWVSWLAA